MDGHALEGMALGVLASVASVVTLLALFGPGTVPQHLSGYRGAVLVGFLGPVSVTITLRFALRYLDTLTPEEPERTSAKVAASLAASILIGTQLYFLFSGFLPDPYYGFAPLSGFAFAFVTPVILGLGLLSVLLWREALRRAAHRPSLRPALGLDLLCAFYFLAAIIAAGISWGRLGGIH